MNRIAILGMLLCVPVIALARQNEWEDPTRFEWNKEKPHACFALYESVGDARTEDYSRSPWYKSLNGT